MDQPGFVEVHEITNIYAFMKNIDWREKWLIALVAFHVFITALSFISRNMANLQIILFISLLSIVYSSEYINELAAANWNKFSNQQYFDSNGLFISCVLSTPLLLNCIFLLARFLYQNFELMQQLAKVKADQVKKKQSQQEKRRRERAIEGPEADNEEDPREIKNDCHAKSD